MNRVIIVEDEPAIARGLSLLITQNYPDFQVIALARNGKDGLSKILELKPDLVFVDINMPVMNGLDMIEQIQLSGFSTRCVILTGYAEFEYARTAIRLGISDYLLKPISPNTLKEIILSFRQQHQSEIRILQTEYIKRCLTHTVPVFEKENPLSGYLCTLLFLFSGPICSNIYTEALINPSPLMMDNQTLRKLEENYPVSLFPLRGRHYNEYIIAAVYSDQQSLNINKLSKEIYALFSSSDTYTNMIISETSASGCGIPELSRNIYVYALFTNPFGVGLIRAYDSLPDQKIHVSQEIKQICSAIPENPSRENLHDFLHSMVLFWKKEKVTQFQLTTDLRYFIGNSIHNCSANSPICPDSAEIVSSCHSYAELERELQYELEIIYNFHTDAIPADQQSLAKQVRNWLDANFTSQITFKIFQDIFGHNEKYISALFKSEFGISPSKYIGELRLNMAKKLMQSNPDILLKDVAEMVGFTDAFYFSRVFKSHEGVSPSLYMKQLKDEKK